MRSTRARRAAAAGSALALVIAGAALAAADTVVPPGRTGSWLADAGLSRSRQAVEVPQVPILAGTSRLGCPVPPVPPAAVERDGTDEEFTAQPVGTTSRVRVVADAATTSELRLENQVTATATSVREDPEVATEAGAVRLAEADAAGAVGVLGRAARAAVAATPSAVQWALTRSGDVRGLSAAYCPAPAVDSWLVGAGTEVGRSTRLVLSNPGATPAVVDVSLLTSTGRQAPRGGQGLLVAPGEVAEVLVEGLAAVDPLLAVGVTSSGGPVSASLVDSAVRGVTPAGVEVVVPSVPAERHVVPGLPGGADGAVLRIAVPGDAPAVVGWRVEGTEGPVDGSAPAATTVPAGSVVDVPIEDVGPGPATVLVEADVPVLAAVQVTRAASAPAEVGSGAGAAGSGGPGDADAGSAQDRAWVASAPELTGTVLVALPGGDVAAVLVLATGAADDGGGAGAEGADVRVVPMSAGGVDGPAVEVSTVPGVTAVVPADALRDAVAVRIATGDAPVRAAVVLTASADPAAPGDDLLSVAALQAPPEPPGSLPVRTAPPGAWP